MMMIDLKMVDNDGNHHGDAIDYGGNAENNIF